MPRFPLRESRFSDFEVRGTNEQWIKHVRFAAALPDQLMTPASLFRETHDLALRERHVALNGSAKSFSFSVVPILHYGYSVSFGPENADSTQCSSGIPRIHLIVMSG
jgi:hypothetical protein